MEMNGANHGKTFINENKDVLWEYDGKQQEIDTNYNISTTA